MTAIGAGDCVWSLWWTELCYGYADKVIEHLLTDCQWQWVASLWMRLSVQDHCVTDIGDKVKDDH